MAHADTKNRFVPLLKCLAELQSRIHAVPWVTWTVGKEKAVILVPDGVEIKVPRKYSHCSVSADEGTKDVRLGTKIENSNSDIPVGVEVVRNLCGSLVDQVLIRGIPVLLRGWRRGRGIYTNGQTAERGSLITQQTRDLASVHVSNTRDVKAATPRSEGFDCGMVRKFLCDVCHDDGTALNSLGLHDDSDILSINGSPVVGNPIISDERSGKDKNLAPIGRVSHRLGVCR